MDAFKRATGSLLSTAWAWLTKLIEWAILIVIGLFLGAWYGEFSETAREASWVGGILFPISWYSATWCFISRRATVKQEKIAFWITVFLSTIVFAVASPFVGTINESQEVGSFIPFLTFLGVLLIPAFIMQAIFDAVCAANPPSQDSDISVGRGQEEDDFSQLRSQHGPGHQSSQPRNSQQNRPQAAAQQPQRNKNISFKQIALNLIQSRWPYALLSMMSSFFLMAALFGSRDPDSIHRSPLMPPLIILLFYALRWTARKLSKQNYSLTAYPGWFHFDSLFLAWQVCRELRFLGLTEYTFGISPYGWLLILMPTLYFLFRFIFQRPLKKQALAVAATGSAAIAPTPTTQVTPPTAPPPQVPAAAPVATAPVMSVSPVVPPPSVPPTSQPLPSIFSDD